MYKILKEYKRANAVKVGMYGASRGGMMTFLSLSKVDWIKAAVVVSGVSNIFEIEKYRPEMRDIHTEIFGESDKARKERSAIYWTEKFSKTSPLLIMHGTADWRVPVTNSISLAKKLYEEEVPYRLIVFEGADHFLKEVLSEKNKQTIEWFNRFLKEDDNIPDLSLHGK